MGGFSVDASEMSTLKSAICAVGDALGRIPAPTAPGVGATGSVVVSEAAVSLADAASLRIGALARWCENTGIHAGDTVRHTEENDHGWADEFTRTLKSDKDVYQ